jgi:hypothetical protein
VRIKGRNAIIRELFFLFFVGGGGRQMSDLRRGDGINGQMRSMKISQETVEGVGDTKWADGSIKD